jgi:HEAT repeat protein
VVSDIARFYRETSLAAERKILAEEKNPDIQATAIISFGAYAKSEVRPKLLEYLNSDSYRSILADAAISAIRAQDDPAYIDPLRDALHDREAILPTGVFSRGLETLSWLGRNEEKKETVRELLTSHVNSLKKRVQLTAISGLGTLGDAKAIAVLETFTGATRESPERAAAERSVASLRDARKPSVELGQLRNEVLNLQKENRELRKDFDELKKKLEAATLKPSTGKTTKGASSTKPPKMR